MSENTKMNVTSKQEEKKGREIVIVEGTVVSARIGTSRFDDKEKCRLSVKCEPKTLDYAKFEKAYEKSGSRLTPNWVKDKDGYINLNSKFDIPCKDITGKIITFEEFTEKSTALGSTVMLSLTIKDGAVYPVAFKVLEEGEELNPFEGLD